MVLCMSRTSDFDNFWDTVSIDEVRNNPPTTEYSIETVRHVTTLTEDAWAFLARCPYVSQMKINMMMKRFKILEKERLPQISILST